MAINTALLIAAPILQDYFSDNATDAAMSAGVITCFKDNSRTTLKNWYYQTGSPGAYTYTQLPNPLTLSAAGTITDAMGNDTIPFWYPYSESDNATPEPYYVTVDNSNGQRQFTRQNFPFIATNANATNATLRNLIVNNVFYRNQGSLSLTNTQQTVLAPSQHEGFLSIASGTQNAMSDIQFIKNANGATDTVTFTAFTNTNQLTNDEPTPEFYLNLQCGNTGTSETTKYIQIPICLHVGNLSGYENAALSIWTQNVNGSANNTIKINLFQFLGTGATSPTATTITTITPASQWTRSIIPFAFPTATLPPGGAGDDGWFLQISYPVGVQFNMNIAKPSVYLSPTVPTDDFDTYEYVSGTINSPRTGDVRHSMNSYQPFGWVPMNDGTIGNASSNSTSRANIDTWPLFNLIWNSVSYLTNVTSIIPIFTSASSPSTFGSSAISDFNANKQLSLPKMLGRAILGGLTNTAGNFQGQIITGVSGNTITMTTSAQFFVGSPVILTTTGTTPGGLNANTVYYAIEISSTAISLATTYANALAGNVITLSSSGTGVNAIFTYIPPMFTGEFQHKLLASDGLSRSELPDPLITTSRTINVTAGTDGTAIESGTAYAGGIISNNNGNTSFNIVQPSTFYNIYMKL